MKAMVKVHHILYVALFVHWLTSPTGALAGSFGTIVVQSDCFQIRAELNTGSMDDPDDEAEEIANWR